MDEGSFNAYIVRMDSECTIFLDIDGILTYRVSSSADQHRYRFDKTKEFTNNVKMLCALLEPNLVCCSSWRYGRTVDQLNEMMGMVLGIQPSDFQFDRKLRDRTLAEEYGVRDLLILRWVD